MIPYAIRTYIGTVFLGGCNLVLSIKLSSCRFTEKLRRYRNFPYSELRRWGGPESRDFKSE